MENSIKETQSDELTLSIVIPTYNRPHLAVNLARQIRKFHSKKYQIVIVDQKNANPLDEKILQELAIDYYNLPKANTSIAKNKGINVAQGNIIIFFDDDVEITDRTIDAHLNAYTDLAVCGVAGRVINDGEEIPVASHVETGVSNFLATKFVYKFWSTKQQLVDFVYGCNMSFKKKTLKTIEGFDENFPKIFEEVDLSRRIKQEGNIIFVPEALVFHHKAKGGGIRKDEKQKEQLIYRNYGYFIAKQVPFPFSLITLFLRTGTALQTYPPAIFSLFKGYKEYFIQK